MCQWPVYAGTTVGGFVFLGLIYIFSAKKEVTVGMVSMAAVGAFLMVFSYASEIVIGGQVIKYKQTAAILQDVGQDYLKVKTQTLELKQTLELINRANRDPNLTAYLKRAEVQLPEVNEHTARVAEQWYKALDGK
jgi:hypothetical protein